MWQALRVGIVDGLEEISVQLKGSYMMNGKIPISGSFTVKCIEGEIRVTTGEKTFTSNREISFIASKKANFSLGDVTVGKGFHWERKKKQFFSGNLILKKRRDGLLCAINEIDLEEYIKSVISSEMNACSPLEFLKAQAIAARSWIFSRIKKKKKRKKENEHEKMEEGEIMRIYGNEEHELFDVCADDHCQRYYGITKFASEEVEIAVEETRGLVLMYGKSLCDTRYSKCCGGITEEFSTAWDEKKVPYLKSLADSKWDIPPLRTESDVERWVNSSPHVFCNVKHRGSISKILSAMDLKTEEFFRWKVSLSSEELEELIRRKTGVEIGEIKNIQPLSRGPSGRIKRLLLEGSKGRLVVGKELEIRRVLSQSHLLSSAFIVKKDLNKKGHLRAIEVLGAGWGHGVGMCQIGAANMAFMGYNFREILKHYFKGTRIVNLYEKEI